MDTIENTITHCLQDAKLSRAANTVRSYENGLAKFKAYLLSLNIDLQSVISEITPSIFKNFPVYLLNLGYSKKTVNVYLASARCLIDWLVMQGIYNPTVLEEKQITLAFKIAHRKREDVLPRFPKDGQAESVLKMADKQIEESPIHERNRAIVLFLYSTGCRNNELVQLKVKDLDFDDHSAIVTGKGSKQRRVYFSSETKEAIQIYWKLRKDISQNAPVFSRHDRGTGNKTQKLTTATIRNIIKSFVLAAGIEKGKFTPHYFRHAFAINMLRNTGNLAIVQDMLGHASPTATRVYAKIYPDDLKKAHEKAYG